MSETILVVGAAGANAGLVVPQLAQRGAHVRALIRKSDQTDAVRSVGAAEVAIGDLTDRASIDSALRNVARLFYIGPAFIEHEAELGLGIVDAACKAGVQRIVFSSVIHPVLSDLVNHAAKARVEEGILNSGLEYVFLHPARFFQNYLVRWREIAETGRLVEPWSVKTRFSRVDYRDVAEVAAIALTEDRLLGGTYELCAEGLQDSEAVAQLLTELFGRPIRAARSDPAHAAPSGAPMQAMFKHYDRIGLVGNALTLSAILGRPPRTLEQFFRELSTGSYPRTAGRNDA
jgi:uncharacterized protein YbjT (DUF2867 family)